MLAVNWSMIYHMPFASAGARGGRSANDWIRSRPSRQAGHNGDVRHLPSVAAEPLSPELALVDPDFRLRPDRGLPNNAPSGEQPAAAQPTSMRVALVFASLEATGQGVWRRARVHGVQIFLTASIFANGLAAAIVLSDTLDPQLRYVVVQSQPAVPPVSNTKRGATASRRKDMESAPPRPTQKGKGDASGIPVPATPRRSTSSSARSQQTRSSVKQRNKPPATFRGVTRAMVERKILAAVVQSPSVLPAALIDRQTGLPEDNIQAICRLRNASISFICVVRPARHKRGEGLHVRYRPGRKGSGVFTWSRYRDG